MWKVLSAVQKMVSPTKPPPTAEGARGEQASGEAGGGERLEGSGACLSGPGAQNGAENGAAVSPGGAKGALPLPESSPSPSQLHPQLQVDRPRKKRGRVAEGAQGRDPGPNVPGAPPASAGARKRGNVRVSRGPVVEWDTKGMGSERTLSESWQVRAAQSGNAVASSSQPSPSPVDARPARLVRPTLLGAKALEAHATKAARLAAAAAAMVEVCDVELMRARAELHRTAMEADRAISKAEEAVVAFELAKIAAKSATQKAAADEIAAREAADLAAAAAAAEAAEAAEADRQGKSSKSAVGVAARGNSSRNASTREVEAPQEPRAQEAADRADAHVSADRAEVHRTADEATVQEAAIRSTTWETAGREILEAARQAAARSATGTAGTSAGTTPEARNVRLPGVKLGARRRTLSSGAGDVTLRSTAQSVRETTVAGGTERNDAESSAVEAEKSARAAAREAEAREAEAREAEAREAEAREAAMVEAVAAADAEAPVSQDAARKVSAGTAAEESAAHEAAAAETMARVGGRRGRVREAAPAVKNYATLAAAEEVAALAAAEVNAQGAAIEAANAAVDAAAEVEAREALARVIAKGVKVKKVAQEAAARKAAEEAAAAKEAKEAEEAEARKAAEEAAAKEAAERAEAKRAASEAKKAAAAAKESARLAAAKEAAAAKAEEVAGRSETKRLAAEARKAAMKDRKAAANAKKSARAAAARQAAEAATEDAADVVSSEAVTPSQERRGVSSTSNIHGHAIVGQALNVLNDDISSDGEVSSVVSQSSEDREGRFASDIAQKESPRPMSVSQAIEENAFSNGRAAWAEEVAGEKEQLWADNIEIELSDEESVQRASWQSSRSGLQRALKHGMGIRSGGKGGARKRSRTVANEYLSPIPGMVRDEGALDRSTIEEATLSAPQAEAPAVAAETPVKVPPSANEAIGSEQDPLDAETPAVPKRKRNNWSALENDLLALAVLECNLSAVVLSKVVPPGDVDQIRRANGSKALKAMGRNNDSLKIRLLSLAFARHLDKRQSLLATTAGQEEVLASISEYMAAVPGGLEESLVRQPAQQGAPEEALHESPRLDIEGLTVAVNATEALEQPLSTTPRRGREKKGGGGGSENIGSRDQTGTRVHEMRSMAGTTLSGAWSTERPENPSLSRPRKRATKSGTGSSARSEQIPIEELSKRLANSGAGSSGQPGSMGRHGSTAHPESTLLPSSPPAGLFPGKQIQPLPRWLGSDSDTDEGPHHFAV